MAFNFGQWLPHLIMGGATVAGSVIGARASGKAAETSAQASEAAAETQLTMSREQLAQLREIYGIDLSLNWPRHRVATESLGNLARGMGSKLPPSAFETTDAPPELPGAGGPGGAPGTGGTPGDSSALDPDSPIINPIRTPPPGTGPSGKGAFASGASAGAGMGATVGSVIPGLGTAIGAGVGALAGAVATLWGRGRREANYIVPSQEDLTRRIGIVGGELSRRMGDGTATDQDWSDAAQIVRSLRDQYYEFSDEYKRAGPGARTTMDSWLNPMLDAWDKRATNWVEDWTTWKYDPNAVWSAPPEGTGGEPPSRRFGGPVGGTLSAMAKKQQHPEYLVGEVGPEMYVDEQGNSSMVGMGGPQMFAPPRDGYIVPNHDLEQQGAITLSDLGDGTYGMPPKQRMLGGPGRGRYMGSRHAGGTVYGPAGLRAPVGKHWHGSRLHDDELDPPPTDPPPTDPPPDAPPPAQTPDAPPPAQTPDAPPPAQTPDAPPTEDPGLGNVWGFIPERSRWYIMTEQVALNEGFEYKKYEKSAASGDPDWVAPPTEDPGPGNVWGFIPEKGRWYIMTKQVALNEGFEYSSANQDSDSGDPDSGTSLVRRGRFTEPWRGTFTGPDAPDPFSYAPGEHGYQPLNEEFSFTTQEYQVPPGMRKELKAWGWEELPDGTWLHDDGYEARLVGDKLVSDEQDVVFDISDYMDTAGDPNRFEDVSKFQTEGVHDALKGLRPHAGYQALNKKFEFDTEDLLKDPGYQFRLDEGAKAIERKGASRGMLQSGRTLQSLSNFSQGLASQEYGNAYDRSLGEFGIRERQTLNAYDRAAKEFGMRRGQSLDAYDKALQDWGMNYGMYGDSYNRAFGEYENKRDEWRFDDERVWGRTLALAGL